MKNNLGQTNQKNFQADQNKSHRPENKDNLDHREGEEQNNKGNDVTHNKKDTKSEKPSQNKDK